MLLIYIFICLLKNKKVSVAFLKTFSGHSLTFSVNYKEGCSSKRICRNAKRVILRNIFALSNGKTLALISVIN